MSNALVTIFLTVCACSVEYASATFGDEYIHIKVRLAPKQLAPNEFAPTFAKTYTRTEHVPAHKIIHHYHYKPRTQQPRHHSRPLLEDVLLAELEKPAQAPGLVHTAEDVPTESSAAHHDNSHTYRVQYATPTSSDSSYSKGRENYVRLDGKEYPKPQVPSQHSGPGHGHGQHYRALKPHQAGFATEPGYQTSASLSQYDTSDYMQAHTDWTPVRDYAEPAPVQEHDEDDCSQERAQRLHYANHRSD